MHIFDFTQISVSASLLLILNENGEVLTYKIVSNDRREELYKLLLDIWKNSERKIITECVYTDNPKVDESFIQKAFEETPPKEESEFMF